MKLTPTLLTATVALFVQSANAGFLFESVPVAPTPLPADLQARRQNAPAPSQQQATEAQPLRDANSSANLAIVTKRNRELVDLNSKLTSRISQSGDAPPELPVLRGMGRDVLLEDFLRQVIPNNFKVYTDQALPLAKTVSWSGPKTWPMVLHGALVDLDMRAAIDWKNREVMFFAPEPKAEPTPVVAKGPGVEVAAAPAPALAAPVPAPRPAAVAAPAVAAVQPAPVAAPAAPAVTWVLSPDVMLRENLRRWATAAGWTLVWNAVSGGRVVDYTVDVEVKYTGELIGVDGIMAKVVSAYYDAEYPLQIEFFRGNKVAEVRLHSAPDVRRSPSVAQSDPSRQPAAGAVDINVQR
jgi:hypothetical protein